MEGYGCSWMAYMLLMIASAGVSLHAGIKFPWFVFFATTRGLRPKEAPFSNMLLAMGIVSAASASGWAASRGLLYDLLPYACPGLRGALHGVTHVVLQLQLLICFGLRVLPDAARSL